MKRAYILGVVLWIIGLAMITSVPYTPKFIWNWYHTGEQPAPKCIECNLENALAHLYLFLMFFGGFGVIVLGSLVFTSDGVKKKDV